LITTRVTKEYTKFTKGLNSLFYLCALCGFLVLFVVKKSS
jgi:hypothetical protein